MKSKRFRIVPKAPDVYIVERKTGSFSWNELTEERESWTGRTYNHLLVFPNKDEAKAKIDTIIREEAALEAHLSQPIEEYPA